MNYFSTKIKVDDHDIDYNGVVRAGALMRYIQSSAEEQLKGNGMSYNELKAANRAFILSKIKLEFDESVSSGEILHAETFPCHSKAYSFIRCYRLIKDERVIGRAVSVWALVNTETRSLVKVNDFELGLETYSPLDLPLERIVMPKELSLVGKYSVNYADIDRNRHMNNTRYPDMLCDFMPDMNGKRMSRVTMSFLGEAALGHVLTVLRGERDGVYYFRTVDGDRVCLEAEVEVVEI